MSIKWLYFVNIGITAVLAGYRLYAIVINITFNNRLLSFVFDLKCCSFVRKFYKTLILNCLKL